MGLRIISIFIVAFCLVLCCEVTSPAQGGWDVWTIYLRDGTQIEAAPVWSLNEKVLKYGMSGEVGEGKQLPRSQIVAMSRNVAAGRSAGNARPELPQGDVAEDLVIMEDGKQASGAVLIRASKDKSGEIQHYSPVLVQKEVETDLRKVEHIKFAKPKRAS